MLAAAGASTVLVTLLLLTSGRSSAIVAFTLVPLAAAVACGFDAPAISKFVMAGLGIVAPVAALFIFAVLFFSIMTEKGLFAPIVGAIVRFAGDNRLLVMLCTVLVAAVTHLDGAGATTYLVTVSGFLPVYRRLGMAVKDLLLLTGTTAGIMNMEPWAPATVRAASVLGIDPSVLWRPLLPVQAAGLLSMVLLAFALAKRPASRPVAAYGHPASGPVEAQHRLLYACNAAVTLAVLACLLFTPVPSVLVFAIGLAVALPINFRTAAAQLDAVRRHAREAVVLAAVLLSAGIFLGVLGSSGMLDALGRAMLAALPSSLTAELHVVVGVFAMPLGMMFGSDAYYFGLLPIARQVGAASGVDGPSVARAMMIGENVGFAISPMVGSAYLLVGLGDTDLGAHIRYAFLYTWLIALVMLCVAMMTGAVQP